MNTDTNATDVDSNTTMLVVATAVALTVTAVVAKRISTSRKIKWINKNGYRVVDL